MGQYKKARWWTLEPAGYNDPSTGEFKIFGVRICYGDWMGRVHLLFNAKPLVHHPRIKRKDRDWLKATIEKAGW